MSTYVCHHGILGQKWGVRRFQNPDGSWKAGAGEAHRKAASRRFEKIGNKISSVKKKLADRKEAKIQTLTKHYKFKNEDISDEEARKKAEKRAKIEKVLAVTAAVTVTAVVAGAAYKHYKSEADQIIKAGTSLQRIEMQDTGGKLHGAFYAANNKADKDTYAGLLGMTRQQQTGHAYKMDIGVQKDLKIAGDKNARKTFKDLYDKDDNFRRYADSIAGDNKGNVKKMYDQFNHNLVNQDVGARQQNEKFYDALKKAGYGGLQDVNDKKMSGFNARNPVIYFNTGKEFAVNSVKEMSNEDMSTPLAKHYMREGGREALKTTAKWSSVGVAAMLAGDYTSTKMVEQEEARRAEEQKKKSGKRSA